MLNTLLNKYPKLFKTCVWSLGALLLYSLSGFFLAPWLIKKNAIKILAENFNTQLRIEKLQINPFVLNMRVTGIEVDDPEDAPLIKIDEVNLNFQLSSIFNRAWTFKEFLIKSPEIFVRRDNNNDFNFSYLSDNPPQPEPKDNTEAGLFPLLIYQFSIENSLIQITDEVPATTVVTRLGPNNIELLEFNTLINRPGQHDILITTESNGTLTWTGSLELNPFSSTGHVSLNNTDFPLLSQYIRNDFGIDITDGRSELEMDYSIASTAEAALSIVVENINIVLSDLTANIFAEATSDSSDDNSELLKLSSLKISEGVLRWPEKTLTISTIAIEDSQVSLLRDQEGILNILKIPLLAGNASPPMREEVTSVSDPEQEWDVSLANFSINSLALTLQDFTVTPAANLNISGLNLDISDISNLPEAQFPTQASIEVQSGGLINLDGQFSLLPVPNLAFDIGIEGLSLPVVQPYLQSLSSLSLDSGDLNLNGQLLSDSEESLAFTGEVIILDLAIINTEEDATLGSWDSLQLTNIELSLASTRLEISEVLFDGPYADIVIAPNGSLNLGQANITQTQEETTGASSPETAENDSVAQSDPMLVTVGRILIENGAANFADFSLPLPFSAEITELEGNISTISTESIEPSEINLEGDVDAFGQVRINGSVSPFNLNSKTNLAVVFQNVEIPKFSAYMIPFAGREIESGKLDLALSYKVTDSQLDSENNILLREFSLGEKVEHKDAADLPLDLAVALLKNTEGNIDLDLPISGDVTDPEFSYGAVIRQVFANIIIKLVTSPFSLLANLVGFEGDDLEAIEFLDGSADLSPPQLEKTTKLAEALSLRPELILDITGVVDLDADGLALREAKLETLLENAITDLNADNSEETMYAQQQKIALEGLYQDYNKTGESALQLENIQNQFITQVEEGGEDPKFDELAYVNELQRQLLVMLTISSTEFDQLANARAKNTQAAVVSSAEELAQRVRIMEDHEEINRDGNESIKMNVTISQKSDSSQ